ncbi:transglutaminase-like domain-containing protein [Hymenobacter cellulosilyticus]|uniref:Transglutaminase-like domain-containing protein n=1 Tax=Hymenobacter cellulosilyticus TaxID=2932248 RepID=A0A8T9QGB8_9BACT|nr:transglutaminase-like domain-containing protein [Hymenobacter cellulosilyticus]UOQ74870.1 transglutaminase-like domain-containing protein [Hymenobacter cellulosilyticus]
MMYKALTGVVLLAVLCASSPAAAQHPVVKNQPLEFTTTADPTSYTFQFSAPDEPYLVTLRENYALNDIVAGKDTDLDKARTLCTWVHNRWVHDGHVRAKKPDPLSILKDADLGHNFQCIEYSIVLSGVLTAMGMPARAVYLKTADSETRREGAGHAITEVWLRDQRKWAMLDAQWDAVPLLNNKPINVIEMQKALATDDPGLRIETASNTRAKTYFNWLSPYLYYFDTVLDNRFGVKTQPSGVMLVPVGAKFPTVFQRDTPIRRMRYTNSVTSFYPTPCKCSWATLPSKQHPGLPA